MKLKPQSDKKKKILGEFRDQFFQKLYHDKEGKEFDWYLKDDQSVEDYMIDMKSFLLQKLQSHEVQVKQDIFKKVEGLIEQESKMLFKDLSSHEWCAINKGFDCPQNAYNSALNHYEQELRVSLKALEEAEISKRQA